MFFNMQIFRKHICTATCGEMYYTEFYFKSDAISTEDGANFYLCCYLKYDIHCTQFHKTALCGDLLNRIPLQIGQNWSREMEATDIYVFMPPSITVTAPIFRKLTHTQQHL
jgi:hypothetical protein